MIRTWEEKKALRIPLEGQGFFRIDFGDPSDAGIELKRESSQLVGGAEDRRKASYGGELSRHV